jgi:uncharacterized protein YndB with AHSA1/START domain
VADFTTSVDIAAPREVVFAHLVTPERMVRWLGRPADLDPVPGGSFAVDVNGTLVRGEYLEVDPPHRLVVSWGMVGMDDLPPGSSRVEFTLTPTGDGTRLDLVHKGLPDSRLPGHGSGWANYLGRLSVAATGRDPGPDTWVPSTASRGVDT